MKQKDPARKGIIRASIAFAVWFIIIILNFGIHTLRTINYVHKDRQINELSTTSDVLVKIAPRGLSSDKWEKNDAYPDKLIYAQIYNATISNFSDSSINDWTLRINIQSDCFINSAWNGNVEIHQFVDGVENVQTLYFLDYDKSTLQLDYILGGQDVLIPLSKGDYIVYYPSIDGNVDESIIGAKEEGSDESGEMIVGFIFYSDDGNMDVSSYEFNYHYMKKIFSGKEFYIFLIMISLFGIGLITFVTSMVTRHIFVAKAMNDESVALHSLELLAKMSEESDKCFEGNAKTVADYSVRVAGKLGVKNKDLMTVRFCALAHDIGNIHVPEYILKKNTQLSEEEYITLKRHTIIGAEMLDDFKATPSIINAAKYHHERYDGKGYPEGKAGEDIPFIGRLLAVTDAYVAMNKGIRPYREPMSPEKARDELVKNSGTQFDPIIVSAMLEIIDEEKENHQ